jgi:hypothetical protein
MAYLLTELNINKLKHFLKSSKIEKDNIVEEKYISNIFFRKVRKLNESVSGSLKYFCLHPLGQKTLG